MAVMQVLWRKAESPPSGHGITGPARGRSLMRFTASARAWAIRNRAKAIGRLEAKVSAARRTLFVHLFSASVGRDELVRARIGRWRTNCAKESLAPVLSHLFKAKR